VGIRISWLDSSSRYFESRIPAFVATSGKADHTIVRFTGRNEDRVSGMVFEISDSELARSDEYEPVGYTRVETTLASGNHAWVYADSRPRSA
jgi:gamma-glutamylcyclotransferase (GGCT)/AIG2-like uncharacterized protein YtfP